MKKKASQQKLRSRWKRKLFATLMFVFCLGSFVYFQARYSGIAASLKPRLDQKPQIAFLFIARNRLPLEFVWDAFFLVYTNWIHKTIVWNQISFVIICFVFCRVRMASSQYMFTPDLASSSARLLLNPSISWIAKLMIVYRFVAMRMNQNHFEFFFFCKRLVDLLADYRWSGERQPWLKQNVYCLDMLLEIRLITALFFFLIGERLILYDTCGWWLAWLNFSCFGFLLSCIPLYSFSYTYNYIMSTPTSFVDRSVLLPIL